MSEQPITLTVEDQRKSNPKASIVRAEVRSARGYANQRAHDLRLGPQPEYVDASLSHLNRVILEPPKAPEMRRLVEERRAQRETSRALKSNARIAVIGVIGFGIEAAPLFAQLTPEQQDKALLTAGYAIAVEANTTMEGLVYHLDETSGHGHVSWCGFDLDGVPLSSTMKRGMLTRFQDRLAEVMAEHCPGIERGKSKWDRINAGADFSETVHKSVRELHEDLPKDIAKKRQELEQVSSQIPALTARVEEMQGRVDKLANEEKQRELTSAKVKRLRTYRSRLADRVGELRAARDELSFLTAQIEEKQKLVTALEGRADQAEHEATTATEALHKAQQAGEVAEARKITAEASVAALAAEKTTLDEEVSTLMETRAQLQPEVDVFEKRKRALETEIAQNQAEVAEARKRAVQAQQVTDELRAGERATKAALEALRSQITSLEKDTQGLAATKAQLQPEIVNLEERKGSLSADIFQYSERENRARNRAAQAKADVEAAEATKTSLEAEVADMTAQKDNLLTDWRKLFKTKKALESEVVEMQKTTQTLEACNNALKTKFADIHDRLEILRPALQAADALQQMSELDLDEQHDAWATIVNSDRNGSPIEHASAIRMIDPLFAPDISLPRSTVLDENLETLHECSDELYSAVLDAVSAEEGSEAGAEAIRTNSVYLDQNGTIAGFGSKPDEPDLIGKALRWAKTAFAGVMRGVGLAIAGTRDGIAEELTAARANLFTAFEPRVQSALRRMLKAEGEVKSQKGESEPERTTINDYEP